MKFKKPAVPIDEQIKVLKGRGMVVDDETSAKNFLQSISYYRLRAYWLPFEVSVQGGKDHLFRKGTRFEDALNVYNFDRDLRLLVLDAIERIEVSLRSRWAYHLAIHHEPHGYLCSKHYKDCSRHKKNIDTLKREFKRSRDTFAAHYRSKYSSPGLPPSWMAVELMSLGSLSKFYGSLKQRRDRQAIARPYGLDEKVMVSFAHHMNYVRNICAHHGRLWNKRFTVTMKVPKRPIALRRAMHESRYEQRYLHNTLVMFDHLLTIIAPGNVWKQRVTGLMDTCPLAYPRSLGFPQDWRTRKPWRVD